MGAVSEVFRRYLRPYQRRWVEDRARRKICLKSRRIGMSEAVVLEALLLALDTPWHDVYLCSTNFTNAKELLRRLGRWLDAFAAARVHIPIRELTKEYVEFQNGSRIIPLSALAVRSRTGTIILDELAFYQRDREVWAAVAPAADTDPNLRLILVSTPFGASGVFWEIWTDATGEHGEWSRHLIDVHQAAAEGFPVDPAELRAKYPEDIWLQEFCCQFLSDINQYFPHDLIRRALWSEPSELPTNALLYGGLDLASARDGSVLADGLKEQQGPAFAIARAHTIKQAGKAMDYAPQFDAATQLLEAQAYAGVAVDATGEGAQLAQDLRRRFGAGLITEIKGGAWAEVHEQIPRMRLAMERGHLLIPNTLAMRTAFAKVSKRLTTTGQVTYEAVRDADGHADEFFASLLAYHAAHTTRHLPSLSPRDHSRQDRHNHLAPRRRRSRID